MALRTIIFFQGTPREHRLIRLAGNDQRFDGDKPLYLSPTDILRSEHPLIVVRKDNDGKVCYKHHEWAFVSDGRYYKVDKYHREWAVVFYHYWRFAEWSTPKQRFRKIRSLGPMMGFNRKKDTYRAGAHMRLRKYEIVQGLLEKCTRLQFEFDTKFCDVDVEPVIVKPHDLRQEFFDVDEDVYQRFKYMFNLKKNKQRDISFSGVPTGNVHGIPFYQLKQIYDAWVGDSKMCWEEIEGEFSYGVCYKKAKKNGELRRVFPMSPKVNAFITQEYGEQNPIYPNNVKIVKGCQFQPFQFAYDVKNCDARVLPYFRRLIRELYPEDEHKILAPMWFNGDYLALPQFPSGVCVFMKYVTSVFTVALLDLGNRPGIYQVQGDGVASNFEIEHDALSEFPPGVINGFKYDAGMVTYVNARERLRTPQILGFTTIRGEALWQFRKEIYRRYLNADVSDMIHKENKIGSYQWMTDEELLKCARDVGFHIEKLVSVLEINGFVSAAVVARTYLSNREIFRKGYTAATWDATPSDGLIV